LRTYPVLPEIFTLGHRNVQGVVWDHLRERIIAHEHGPRGGDEINLLLPGANYGWPVVTSGIDYSGAIISPYRKLPGYQSPLLTFTPSIAPADMALYDGELFPIGAVTFWWRHWHGRVACTAYGSTPAVSRCGKYC
jgi:aldose sugar dehydrogenase